MPAIIVVGAQWGDEGKGRVVDWLARDVDLSCALIEKHIRTTVEQAASEVPGLTMNTIRVAKRRKS